MGALPDTDRNRLLRTLMERGQPLRQLERARIGKAVALLRRRAPTSPTPLSCHINERFVDTY